MAQNIQNKLAKVKTIKFCSKPALKVVDQPSGWRAYVSEKPAAIGLSCKPASQKTKKMSGATCSLLIIQLKQEESPAKLKVCQKNTYKLKSDW
jgi:hypothetical protein